MTIWSGCDNYRKLLKTNPNPNLNPKPLALNRNSIKSVARPWTLYPNYYCVFGKFSVDFGSFGNYHNWYGLLSSNIIVHTEHHSEEQRQQQQPPPHPDGVSRQLLLTEAGSTQRRLTALSASRTANGLRPAG